MRRQPIQERACKLVEGILDAAAEVISEVGYAAATTNTIAERAGVSIGSLYQYFAKKEDILGALLDKLMLEAQREMIECMAKVYGKPFPEACFCVLDTYVHFLRRHRPILEPGFEHVLGASRITRINAFERQMAVALQGYLTMLALERGNVPLPEHDLALTVVQILSTMGTRISFETEDEAERRRAIQRVCDLICIGVGLREPKRAQPFKTQPAPAS